MSSCIGLISRGIGGTLITVECHTSNSLPTIIVSGSANKAVAEAKHRLRGAFAHSTIRLPKKRITINLAPVDIPKSDSSLDLAIAAAIVLINEQKTNYANDVACIGELGLDGSVKAVRGIVGKLLAGRGAGIKKFIIPSDNLDQAQLVPHIDLIPIRNLNELKYKLTHTTEVTKIATGSGQLRRAAIQNGQARLDHISGHSEAKRLLTLAASGGHHLLLTGPPGSGKSALAQSLASLLPSLSHEAALEATQMHSLASHSFEDIVTQPPSRAPHHSATVSQLLGGGAHFKPGEVHLSHNGVLVLDELPEFSRMALESLRQPLEHFYSIASQDKESQHLPARFILAATANPCPCGYASHQTIACTCTSIQKQRYITKLSGPLLDRIDLHHEVHSTAPSDLFSFEKSQETSTTQLRKVVGDARKLQYERYQSKTMLNGSAPRTNLMNDGNISSSARRLLENASNALLLSSRGLLRTLSVARTIADMDSSPSVTEAHVAEALHYRPKAVQV